MTAIATCACLDNLPAVAHWLRHADTAKVINAAQDYASAADRLEALVRQNVVAQLANIQTHPSVALALAQNRVDLHGWVYDIAHGSIAALDGDTKAFVSLSEYPETVAVKTRA